MPPNKLLIPGTYALGTAAPADPSTVVKLATGEKVHLLSGFRPKGKHVRKGEVLRPVPSERFVQAPELEVPKATKGPERVEKAQLLGDFLTETERETEGAESKEMGSQESEGNESEAEESEESESEEESEPDGKGSEAEEREEMEKQSAKDSGASSQETSSESSGHSDSSSGRSENKSRDSVSAENTPLVLPALDTVSPHAGASFSPGNKQRADIRLQTSLTLQEVTQSEYMYIKSLALLRNFFVEPLLVKCQGMLVTCTPLLHMHALLQRLVARHEHFHGRLTERAPSLHSYATLVQTLFVGPAYGDYAAYAHLILLMVERQTPPFVPAYIKGLQKFLEQNQPRERRMDLSLSSLLQKPMGRIAKYRLFLVSLEKLAPGDEVVAAALEALNSGLSRINAEITAGVQAHAYDVSAAIPTEAFGIVRAHVPALTALWLVYDGRKAQFEVMSRDLTLVIFDHHLVVLDGTEALFVVPRANIVALVGEENGLCTEDEFSSKVRFQKQDCTYELVFRADSFDDNEELREYLQPQEGVLTDGDCRLEAKVAQYDINPKNPQMLQNLKNSCYFQKNYTVRLLPALSRLKSLIKRRLWLGD